MNENDKIIQEQFNKMPKELQVATNSTPWKSIVREIALLNRLSQEQTENLEREAMFILYGFENPADFVKNLIQEVPLNEETAIAIVEQVNEKILKLIAAMLENSNELSNNLPMIEKGEVAHDVPHVEHMQPKVEPETAVKTQSVPTTPTEKPKAPSSPHYPGGLDPYREPIN